MSQLRHDFWSTSPEAQRFKEAARFGDKEKVKDFLKKHGPGILDEALLQAVSCSEGKTAIVELLLKEGADIEEYDFPPLVKAAGAVDSKAVTELLLDRGADIDAQDIGGKTALMTASGCHWNEEITKVLLKRGADTELRDDKGYTALMIAVDNGLTDMAGILLEGGADINAKDKLGQTALVQAIREEDYTMVKFLLEQGADANAKDGDRATPLMHAIEQITDPDGTAEMLLEYGAVITSSARNLAAECERWNVLQTFDEWPAKQKEMKERKAREELAAELADYSTGIKEDLPAPSRIKLKNKGPKNDK